MFLACAISGISRPLFAMNDESRVVTLSEGPIVSPFILLNNPPSASMLWAGSITGSNGSAPENFLMWNLLSSLPPFGCLVVKIKYL